MIKCQPITKYILQGGFGGTPTADSRFAVPCSRGQSDSHLNTTINNIRDFKQNTFLNLLTLHQKKYSH